MENIIKTLSLLIASFIMYITGSGMTKLSKNEKIVNVIWVIILIVICSRF